MLPKEMKQVPPEDFNLEKSEAFTKGYNLGYQQGFSIGFSGGYQACENSWDSFVKRYIELEKQVYEMAIKLKSYDDTIPD